MCVSLTLRRLVGPFAACREVTDCVVCRLWWLIRLTRLSTTRQETCWLISALHMKNSANVWRLCMKNLLTKSVFVFIFCVFGSIAWLYCLTVVVSLCYWQCTHQQRCSSASSWVGTNTPFTWYSRLLNRVVQTVWQPCWTNSHCSFHRLSNWVVQSVWQPAVYTIQPVVKPVQLVECLYTRYNRLSDWQPVVSCIQTFNQLSNSLTTGLTTGCIV